MNENNLNNRIDEESGHIEHNLTPRVLHVLKKANNVSLTHDEKHQGAHALKQFMAGGITEAEAIKLGKASTARKKVPSPYFDAISTLFASASVSFKKRVLVPVAAILIFTLAVGTTYAASEALPGDVLYPVKINVNENIEAALAVSSKAKAKVAVEHAVNRLEEAEKLAAKGNLKPAVQADLVARFNAETDKVDNQTEKLKVSGDIEDADNIKTGFENSLRAHSNAISKISERSGKKKRVEASSTSSEPVNSGASNRSRPTRMPRLSKAAAVVSTESISTAISTTSFTSGADEENNDGDNNDSLSEIKAAVRVRLDSGGSKNKNNKDDSEGLRPSKKERRPPNASRGEGEGEFKGDII